MNMKNKKMAPFQKIGFLCMIIIWASLAVACGAAKSEAPKLVNEQAAKPVPAATQAPAAGQADEKKADDQSIALKKQTPQARIIIYTGNIALVVKDVSATINLITDLANKKEGYVSASNIYQYGNGTITIRVPATQYQATLTELRAMAVRVDHESSNTQDVTEEYVDLEARLKNLETAELALQKLLDERQRVGSTSDILDVYRELTNIRGQIEQIEGRMRFLNNQAALSTITVDLWLNVLSKPVSAPTWQPLEVAQEALQMLVSILQNVVNGLIWGTVCGLPLILLVPFGFVIWRFRRWKKAQSELKN